MYCTVIGFTVQYNVHICGRMNQSIGRQKTRAPTRYCTGSTTLTGRHKIFGAPKSGDLTESSRGVEPVITLRKQWEPFCVPELGMIDH